MAANFYLCSVCSPVKLLGEIWGNQSNCSHGGNNFNQIFLLFLLVLNPGYLKLSLSVSSVSLVSVPLLGQAKQAAGVRTWQKWTIQGPGTDNTLIVRLFSPEKTSYSPLKECNTLCSSDFFVKSACDKKKRKKKRAIYMCSKKLSSPIKSLFEGRAPIQVVAAGAGG